MADVTEPYLSNHGKIALEGLHNTRDLGGLPAGAGSIRPRRLLRSGMLASATPGDMESLRDDYDVRLVIDLRTDEEAAYSPDPMELIPEARGSSACPCSARRRPMEPMPARPCEIWARSSAAASST